MFHTVANFLAIANVANTNLPPVADGVIAVSNARWLPQRDYEILYIYSSGVTQTQTRLVSPTNRQITLPFIRPIQATLLPPTDPNVSDYRQTPFRIRALEELAFEGTNTTAGTENSYVISGWSTGFEPPPRGEVFTLRGASTTAAVASTWTQITVTWADTPPAGTYAVLGLDVIATNQIAARAIFENQTERPGAVCSVAVANRPHDMFSKGRLGVWGRFKSTRMPIIEVLNNGTDAVHTAFLDIVRVA